jgi:pimeloyl-ACP methyl ester carboxylesterase
VSLTVAAGATTEVTPAVREIVLDAGGMALSALLAEPAAGPPRAVLVALHGAGLRAGYFDGRVRPGQSLLELGAELGFLTLAVDRPGYGRSAHARPRGLSLDDQAEVLGAALADIGARFPTGAGVFVVAHSHGGKVALVLAAGPHGGDLLGLDLSGVGLRYAVDEADVSQFNQRAAWSRHWGPLGLYPAGTFRTSSRLVSPVPEWEQREVGSWPDRLRELGARLRVPLRLTFGEHEGWWRHDPAALAELTEVLAGPRVVVERLPHAGHNISLGLAARAYHLRALAFLEECLTGRELRAGQP